MNSSYIDMSRLPEEVTFSKCKLSELFVALAISFMCLAKAQIL